MCIDVQDADPLAHDVRLEYSDRWVEMFTVCRDLEGDGETRAEALLTIDQATRLGTALIALGEAARRTSPTR